jgi:hypothetical protein
LVQQIELEKVSMIYSAGERSMRRTLLLRLLRLGRRTWGALFAGCVCIGLFAQEAFAIDLVFPETSSWFDYKAPAHGYALQGPADWHPSYPNPETSRNIIVLKHPDNISGCALLYTPVAPGAKVDIDSYLEYMTDERLMEMASHKYSPVSLLERKAVEVSDRKSLLSIFAGERGGGYWIVMTVSTIRENKIYELQCISRPEIHNEMFSIFLEMADSLEIAPD